jgi:CspA family cold shock protein
VPQGKITRLVRDRGFGFISVADSSDEVFFHHSALSEGSFDALQEGQTLEFDIQPDTRDPRRNRAVNVKTVE